MTELKNLPKVVGTKQTTKALQRNKLLFYI